MKFQDSSFNGLKVTVGTKSVTHPPTHARTHPRTLQKQYAPSTFYAPNFEKVDGAYCFWSVRAWVRACVTLFVPTVTFKPFFLKKILSAGYLKKYLS